MSNAINVIKEVKLSDNNGMVVYLQQVDGRCIEEMYMNGEPYGMSASKASDFEKLLNMYTKRMGTHVVL